MTKEQMKKLLKKEKGITLIALVVTIIILLILAGVTINMALSQNGLFSRAKNAADQYKKAQDDEERELYGIEYVAEGKQIEEISSKEEFERFKERVNSGENLENKVIKLNIDIDLAEGTWTPIGTKDHPFKGIFDGNGHKIENIKIEGANACQGLFGYNEGTIKNVKIEKGQIIGTNEIGGIVGLNNGGTIDNCISNNLEIKSDTGKDIGGIVGKNEKNGLIRNCKNSSSIIGTDNAGGIIGYITQNCIVEGCSNNGKIESNDTKTTICSRRNCWKN